MNSIREIIDPVLVVFLTILFVLSLKLCMLGKFSCFCCRLLTFFQNPLFGKNLSGTQSKCQVVVIQIRIDSVKTLFKIISRWQNSQLAREELNQIRSVIAKRIFSEVDVFIIFPPKNYLLSIARFNNVHGFMMSFSFHSQSTEAPWLDKYVVPN